MATFKFYISPIYYRLFGVKPGISLQHLWDKKSLYYAGQNEEEFRKNNPKTFLQISEAWNLLSDPETQPYRILGIGKDATPDQIRINFTELSSRFPAPLFPEVNAKISQALAILYDPEKRLFVDFFTFDDNVWNLYLLDNDNEIEVRREIEKQFSGATYRQIINSTLYCYLKACHIEHTDGDRAVAASFWKKAYLGWQGILQESFIWEELRQHVLRDGLFSAENARSFDDETMSRVKSRLGKALVFNALERCRHALSYSVQGALDHLGFLKYLDIQEPQERTAVARMYNQCAYVVSRESRMDDASALLQEALRLDPDLPEAATNMGLIRTATSDMGYALRLLAEGKDREALDLLKKALAADPGNNDVMELLCAIYHKLSHDACRRKDYFSAIELLTDAGQHRKDLAEELKILHSARQSILLSDIIQYLENEEYEPAVRYLIDFLGHYPAQAGPRKLLLRVLNRLAIRKNSQRLWVDARDLLKQAADLEPDNEIIQNNLALVEKTAENQQIADELSQAAESIEKGKPRAAIDILQPVYTQQTLPPAVRDEIRRVLARAYFEQGMLMAREAETAVSRGAIKEAFESAHSCLTVSEFLDSKPECRTNLRRLEDALPELIDREYPSDIFPRPFGEAGQPVIRKRSKSLMRKLKSRMKTPIEFINVAFTVPKLMPVTFLPLLLISLFVVRIFGGGIIRSILLASCMQVCLSSWMIASLSEKKPVRLVTLSTLGLLLALFNIAHLAFLTAPTVPDRATPKPGTTPMPTPTPMPTVFYEPKPGAGPGLLAPFQSPFKASGENLVKKWVEAKRIPAATPTPRLTPKPASTPRITPTPPPGLIGKTIPISFSIRQFDGIRQEPFPMFVYRIQTPKGPATLLMDPLVYIKIPKEGLMDAAGFSAEVKVIQDQGMPIYQLESYTEMKREGNN